MTFIEGFLIFTTVCTCASIIAMMHVFKSFEDSFQIMAKFMVELSRHVMDLKFSSGRDYESGVQGVAEDTKVEQ